MNSRVISGMMVMLFLAGTLSDGIAVITKASSTTTFYVDPASIDNPALTPGSIFSVDVKVSDALFIYSWQVFMSWDKAVLEYSSHVFGGFLDDQPGGSGTAQRIEEEWLFVGEITTGMHPGKTAAEGVLVTITFAVRDIGETVLNLDSRVMFGNETDLTYYYESAAPPELIKRYPVRENGYFNNYFSVHEAIDELKTEVEDLGSEGEIDNHGIIRSLLAKLNVAQKLADKDKTTEAKSILEEDFIPQVENLTDIHITSDAADLLIESAEYILSNL